MLRSTRPDARPETASSFSLMLRRSVWLNRIPAVCGSIFLTGMLLLSLSARAQAPHFLPADIPLDVDAIFEELQPDNDYVRTTRGIIDQLRDNHYSDIHFDDNFSGNMLDSYIKTLDGGRIYFTAADISEFEKYRHTLDDLLLSGNTDAGYQIFNRYQHRLIERLVYSIGQVENEQKVFDFTIDESMMLDRSEAPWPADQAELEDLWRQQVKSSVLSLKLTDKELSEVRELLSKRFRSQLSQVLKTNGLDVYQRYMDAMTMTFDPHTQYYAPRAAENFNMSMRLSLEGIGAVLTTEDEYTKVVSIVTGGPADMAGELQPSDKIVGVAQGDEAFVDVIGWRVDDVVQLVRGEKGSVVRLNVVPDGSGLETREIRITRDTVKLEESSAKSEVVEVEYDGKMHKIGVIELPTFYIDFEAMQRRDPNYRSSTRDVRDQLVKLKAEGVEAVVMDLRRNGGGSLSEANSLVGLFIRRGPTVQVRDADGNNIVQGDSNEEIVYDGPMAVLVNRLSASASEIFAGAIQDYQRGVVLGSQTFGKGTVQELIPMEEGQMKITRAKFYRISGESTQHKGVSPDITFPDLYDVSEDIGESALPTALPWDTIQPNYYTPYADLKSIMPMLVDRHEKRLETDPDFVYIRAQIAKGLENRDDNQVTLNEVKLLAEREENDQWRLATENARRLAKGMELLTNTDELDEELDEELDADSSAQLPGRQPTDDLQQDEAVTEPEAGDADNTDIAEEEAPEEPDPYLVESGKILMDIIRLQDGSVTLAAQQ